MKDQVCLCSNIKLGFDKGKAYFWYWHTWPTYDWLTWTYMLFSSSSSNFINKQNSTRYSNSTMANECTPHTLPRECTLEHDPCVTNVATYQKHPPPMPNPPHINPRRGQSLSRPWTLQLKHVPVVNAFWFWLFITALLRLKIVMVIL